jgi:hypothetical protein
MKRIVSGALTIALMAGLCLTPASALSFQDVQNHWGKDAIDYVTEQGFFSGTGADTFSPDVSMTRGMFVTVLAKTAKWLGNSVDSQPNSVFSDVSADAYYAPYVAWAYENGVVAGVSSDRFAPNQPITREQMCAILVKFLSNYAGLDLSAYGQGSTGFLDQASIEPYAKQAVAICADTGLISGVSVSGGVAFQPKQLASRAAVAAVLYQTAEKAKLWLAGQTTVQPGSVSGGTAGSGTVSGGSTAGQPSEAERAQETAVSGYLANMLKNYRNSNYVKTTDQPVQNCMNTLMTCIQDALNQRASGQFLSPSFIQQQYASEIASVKAAYNNLTDAQKNQLNNVIVRLESTDNIYTVMNYFGLSGI